VFKDFSPTFLPTHSLLSPFLPISSALPTRQLHPRLPKSFPLERVSFLLVKTAPPRLATPFLQLLSLLPKTHQHYHTPPAPGLRLKSQYFFASPTRKCVHRSSIRRRVSSWSPLFSSDSGRIHIPFPSMKDTLYSTLGASGHFRHQS